MYSIFRHIHLPDSQSICESKTPYFPRTATYSQNAMHHFQTHSYHINILLTICIFHYMHIIFPHILLLTSPWFCPASSVYRWMFHNITIQLLGYPLWLKNCSHWFHRTFQIFHCWSSQSSVASRPNSMDVRRWTQGAQEGGQLLL